MKAIEEEPPICEHFQRAAELIGKRWNPQIVRATPGRASAGSPT